MKIAWVNISQESKMALKNIRIILHLIIRSHKALHLYTLELGAQSTKGATPLTALAHRLKAKEAKFGSQVTYQA